MLEGDLDDKLITSTPTLHTSTLTHITTSVNVASAAAEILLFPKIW